jgi:hypothetical protein
MYHKERLGIEIILPHWFDDCYKLQQRLPTDIYAFPNPKLFASYAQLNATGMHQPEESVAARLLRAAETKEKNVLYRTILEADGIRPPRNPKSGNSNLWQNKKIMLSKDLDLAEERRANIEQNIENAGGIVIRDEKDVDQIDILIARYRLGEVYHKVSFFITINEATFAQPLNYLGCDRE